VSGVAGGASDERIVAGGSRNQGGRHPDGTGPGLRGALPVGEHQTISQPYIVALMTQLARVEPCEKVLDSPFQK
jgi:hypothetical protein